MALNIGMKELLEAGVHFGHQTKRWNPKMKPYIYTERNDIFIIDLQKTLAYLENAYEFVKNLIAEGGTILFVGTKKQAQEAIQEQSIRAGMPYVNHRWLGGMLTNWQTISKRLDRLKELEKMKEEGIFEKYPKKEKMHLEKEFEKLQRNLGGIREVVRLPDALYVVDTKNEETAVREAKKLDIPIVAIVDTNCDPDDVDYVIPGNDDAIRSAALITRAVADAVLEGREMYESKIAEAEAVEEKVEEEEVSIHVYEPEKPKVRKRARKVEEAEEVQYEGIRVFEPEPEEELKKPVAEESSEEAEAQEERVEKTEKPSEKGKPKKKPKETKTEKA